MVWEQALEAHLYVARRIYTARVIGDLARCAGIRIDPVSGNGATGYPDLLRYLRAVRELLGHQAWVSAKLTLTGRMRELGLAADLPRANDGRAAGPRPVPAATSGGDPA